MTTTWRPRQRAPLGLPPGSVRALLAILIVCVVLVQTVRGHSIDLLWSETLMIVLAHYFSTRRMIDLPAELRRQLEESGAIDPEPRPLYLPRHTIRAAIMLSFVAVAVYLYREGRLFRSQAIESIWLVFAYFLGIALGWLRDWSCRIFNVRPRWWWADSKAIVALLATGACVAFYLAGRPDLLQPWQRDAVLGFVLFYFGSR
jgi:hypothetical protein